MSGNQVWVAAWVIHWDAFPPSFGIVGVATTKEHAEQMLADVMADQYKGAMLDRNAYPNAQTWLAAIAQTCEAENGWDLREVDIEFLVLPNTIHAPSEGE